MIAILKLLLVNKINSTANLSYLINSISDVGDHIDNASDHLNTLHLIKRKISDPITTFVTPDEIESIDKVAQAFCS
jgi:hypothetical protein